MKLFNNGRVRPLFGKAERKDLNPSAGGYGLADGRSDARRSERSGPQDVAVHAHAAASGQAFDDDPVLTLLEVHR